MALTLAEKFILIAHHPEKGRYAVTQFQHQYGLIGSFILDLSLKGILVAESGKIHLKTDGVPDDELLKTIVQTIALSGSPRRIRYWLRKFAFRYRKFKWAIYEKMAKQWIIKIEKLYFLGIIPYRRCYVRNTGERLQIIATLRESILYHKEMSDELTALAALVMACSMQRKLTTNREELKVIKKELKRIIKENPIASQVSQTINEVQAAVSTAIIASTVAASTAGH